jgi:hypothetical protein
MLAPQNAAWQSTFSDERATMKLGVSSYSFSQAVAAGTLQFIAIAGFRNIGVSPNYGGSRARTINRRSQDRDFLADVDDPVSDFLAETRPAGLLGQMASLGIVDPPPVGDRRDDLQDGTDVVAELGAEPEQLGFFRRIGYNAFCRDALAQDCDLSFEESDLRGSRSNAQASAST